ncbi:MAG: hypothetical protein WCF82_04145 [Microcoleus sp.]
MFPAPTESKFHRITVLSALEEARVLPSGDLTKVVVEAYIGLYIPAPGQRPTAKQHSLNR